MTRIALLTLFVLGFGVVPAFAQEFPGAEPLSAIISPQHPRPFQLISISPRSTLVDLSASAVEVLVDGVVVYTGSGTQAVTAQVGGLGSKTVVRVRVTDPSGFTYSKDYTIRPAEVSLVMEPTSTTHPFYLGGSLVAPEATVRLLAISDLRTAAGTRIPSNTLVYTWRVGNRILTDASGVGKSTLTATSPVRYRNAEITVTVTSPDNTLVGEAKTTLSAVDPITRIYRSDPLLGPNYDVALTGKYTMSDTEATFRAVGYYFASLPTLEWRVNSSLGGNDKDITVRSTGSGAGTAQLQLSAKDTAHYQSAESRLSVLFGRTSGGLGIFGL